MKVDIRLYELLQQSDEAMKPFLMLIGQGSAAIDCSGVDALEPEQLDLIFSHVPEHWDMADLWSIIDVDTLSDTLASQLEQWVNRRQGRPGEQGSTPAPSQTPDDSPALATLATLPTLATLDIFKLRDEVIEDYRQYVESFLKIRDPRVKDFVYQDLERGELWPDPLVQLNPSYRQGANIPALVKEGILHPSCDRYFPGYVSQYSFRLHQEQAFRIAQRQEPYVLTTGTGSGKSMTYVVPIFDDLLRNPQVKGVRAILVYPMNALINSQKEEFDKFLSQVPESHIRVAKYTGQENLEQKTEIQNNPPQILLTNYMMLELMLSRNHEEKLVASPDLKFLVLDELHTYRGRQGADVAILIRKLRQRCGQKLLCIGTSATMSTEGTRSNRNQTVAAVASKLFGVEVKPKNVIDETLERTIQRPEPSVEELRKAIAAGLPPEAEQTLEVFRSHPLAAWIEMTFGLQEEEGHLVRRTPISLVAGAEKLAQETQTEIAHSLELLRGMFVWGSKTGGLAFRLHQFISQGGSVYATAEKQGDRLLTLEGQYTTTEDRLLYPLVFCRECGQDYYLVHYDGDRNEIKPLLPTALANSLEDDANIQEGYITLDEPELWNEREEERLPDTWFNENKRQGKVPKKEYAKFIPQRLQVLPNGRVVSSLFEGTACWFTPKPFLTCLNCGVVYDKKKKEFAKLSRLSSEGRSTATTLLCLSTVNRLKISGAIPPQAQKILSFTDNRQDASLQAGHFNDFVQTSLLRAALNGAIQTHQTLTHEELVQTVVEQMGLSQADYAKQVSEVNPGKKTNEQAFRKLIEYRLYEDLRKGWRIVQPNLEQCGLLSIEYDQLLEQCEDVEFWQKHHHPIWQQATAKERYEVIRAVLDQLRKDLVLDVELLQSHEIEKLKKQVYHAIKEPWCFDEYEELNTARWATISTEKVGRGRDLIKLTARSKIGKFLRSAQTWPWLNQNIAEADYDSLIKTFIAAMTDAGYLLQKEQYIQVQINKIIWKAQQASHIKPDPMTSKRLQGTGDVALEVNQFFQEFYGRSGPNVHNMEGREHTGQVKNEDRKDRETRFRNGELATLFCSPTMELGIDISDLNVVHMRNVPPSPANYAQRSGRAGRGGQRALVITYASVGSGHDQYFFRRPEQMVAGVVVPPKLELGNQELIKAHIHSLWLAHTGLYLESSMNQILDLQGNDCPLKETIRHQLTLSPNALERCFQATKAVLEDAFCTADLQRANWYTENFLRQTLETALKSFDNACDRWRNLYRDAVAQLEASRQIGDKVTKGLGSQEEKKNAEAQEREAKRQIDLLVGQTNQGKNPSQLEFYPYRYFASEGFLPGYNFPRLPVRAYVPAGKNGEFISRPKVVAIREFAPQNTLYYEGSKFQIAKTRIPVKGIESEYKRVALCPQCGYLHAGNDWQQDICENCGTKIAPDSYGNPAKLNRVLEMETMLTRRRERITCDEEERLKYGYNVTTHFRFDPQKREQALVTDEGGKKLLKITYGDTANIWRINRGLKTSQERGFKVDRATGTWGETKGEENSDTLQTEVHLMVEDVCNVLLIEPEIPPSTHSDKFLASFQYAMEKAIQLVYKLEENELSSERLGQGKYILFWEASEGGAGVLSQVLENPKAFQTLAQEALNICHFVHEKESCAKACYECLLSYRNQFDHPLLDRHEIREYFERLTQSTINRHSRGMSREEQYQQLRAQTDPNSAFEREVLDELYNKGTKLPDSAQELIPEANVKPDFLYREEKIAIFCDGSVHDHPEQQEQDRIARKNLEYYSAYQALTLRYNEDWKEKLKILEHL